MIWTLMKTARKRNGERRRMRLEAIRTDAGTQSRARIDEMVVADYAEAMIRGDKFPPVVVFQKEACAHSIAARPQFVRPVGCDADPVALAQNSGDGKGINPSLNRHRAGGLKGGGTWNPHVGRVGQCGGSVCGLPVADVAHGRSDQQHRSEQGDGSWVVRFCPHTFWIISTG